MDAIGIQAAGRHHFLYFGNADFRGSGHGIIEVTSRFAEYEITRFVGFPSLDDRDVGKNPALQYIFLPVEDFHFLALGNLGADSGLGIKSGNSGPTRAVPLSQRSLRAKFHFVFAGQILALELLVLTYIGADHRSEESRVGKEGISTC